MGCKIFGPEIFCGMSSKKITFGHRHSNPEKGRGFWNIQEYQLKQIMSPQLMYFLLMKILGGHLFN